MCILERSFVGAANHDLGFFHFFLLRLRIGLLLNIFINRRYISIIGLLAVLVPISLVMLYKVNIYIEDLWFCRNDFNGILIFITRVLLLLIILSSWAIKDKFYWGLHIRLVLVLFLCFSTNNLLWFYITFEIRLLPILLIIIGWGYQPERLQAGLYIIIYTILGSMPLLILILYLYYFKGSFNLYTLFLINLNIKWWYYFGFLAFLIKLPVFSVHIWLPKAHVEAPLGGSIILAGALLKLGGYGLYLYNAIITTRINRGTIIIIVISMWGALSARLICLSQIDIKSLIAYSRVVHIGLVVIGVLSNTVWGRAGALITIVAHGWASSRLFLIAYITYERISSRSFNYTKGILHLFPLFRLLWFIAATVNMAVPPTINLIGELFIVPVAIWLGLFIISILAAILFFRVTYNLYLYSIVNHGAPRLIIIRRKGITSRSLLSIVGHFLPLFLLFSLELCIVYTEYCI